MEDPKMSDVFGVCCKSVVAESFGQYLIVNEVDTARFKNRKHTGAVAHAINNHDRMVEEIAELKGKLESIWSIVETEKTCNAGYWDEEFGAGEVFDEIQELAKLNQEGEDCENQNNATQKMVEQKGWP